MRRAGLPLAPGGCSFRRFTALCTAGAMLLPLGCQVTLPMKRLMLNGVPTPTPLSSARTPPLRLAAPQEWEDDGSGPVPPPAAEAAEREDDELQRTSFVEEKKADEPAPPQTLPAPDPLPASVAAGTAARGVAVNFSSAMRLTFEHNGEILVSRERVNESQIALDAALRSCMPEMLRKDIFKTPVAEATVWRRRVELRRTEQDQLQDTANTYFDWLTAIRGEEVARDLMKYEEKLLSRARRLARIEKPTQVLVEATQTAINGRKQYILQVHEQGEAAAFKLASLMGMNGPVPTATEPLEPMDRVDTSVSVEVLVRQAQDNGPGVRELQGLIASIQQGIEQASGAQCICAHTGAALVCGRLQIAQSQLQQAQLALVSLHTRLRAGVEEAVAAILSGREEIARATDAIQNAAETYRLMDLRLQKQDADTTLRNNTHNAVLSSLQQLSQAHANYLRAVSSYNKAQARLLLYLGAFNEAPTGTH